MTSFFCDENITKAIIAKLREFDFITRSVSEEKLYGLRNGDLLELIIHDVLTLITFDKDFLEIDPIPVGGIIVIDVHPTNDRNVIPVLEDLLISLKRGEIVIKKKIVRLTKK